MALDPDIQEKYVHNGKVMLGSAILLFILILVIIFYRTYAHICNRRRRRYLFSNSLSTATSSSVAAAAATFNERLDPSVLKSLPTFTFSSAAHRSLQDCAVCLSEFEDGEKGRVLPNCGHAFHSSCIDMWFGSHSNCPLCRAKVQPVTPSSTVEACSVSVRETIEVEVGGCSSLPPPVMCPRKPLTVIVELSEEHINLDHRILSLKRFCSV